VMAVQSLNGPDRAIAEYADAHDNRREHLVNALNELKSNIARIEQQHTYLGNDLSSTCDRAILSLRDSLCSQGLESPTEGAGTLPQEPGVNGISLTLDKTATHIISGLEKMGDGIIFLFLKVGRVFGSSGR
jgi:hypothetical protein